MSVRKLTAGLLLTLITSVFASNASAQNRGYSPAVDPFAFDPDFRWFEPVYDVDLDELKPEKRAPTGWFGTYDRLNLYGSRPETNFSPFIGGESKLDSGWGHRYEIGYMLPHEDNGWSFTYTENDVNDYFTVRHEAANRFLDDDADGGVTTDQFGRTVPAGEGNVLNYQVRFFDENRSINVFDYESYELIKTWRMTPYHYGGILEPMVGLRWMRLEDQNAQQQFIPAIDTLNGTVNLGILGLQDQLITDEAITDNEMITGQVGFRYFKYMNRFKYSADFRVFAGGNYQCSRFVRSNFIQSYGDDTTIDIGEPGVGIRFEATDPVVERNEEFVVGFDLRTTLGYQLTRMIQIQAGLQLIDIGTGVWRGGGANATLSGDRDQDLVMLGGSFGISLNH